MNKSVAAAATRPNSIGGADIGKARTLGGLDAHAAKIVAAILVSETGELRFQRLGGQSGPVVELCRSLPGPMRATYEAGPTGYGLPRGLISAEVDCLVAAPGKISHGATDRIKTDRRDAEHLVRLLLAGNLSPVRKSGKPTCCPAACSGSDPRSPTAFFLPPIGTKPRTNRPTGVETKRDRLVSDQASGASSTATAHHLTQYHLR